MKNRNIQLFNALSRQEKKAYYYYLIGLTAKKISEKIEVAPRTVESYLISVKTKLNCQNRQDLFEFAKEAGLIEIMHAMFL